MSVVVDEQFQKASARFTTEQERVNGFPRAEHDRLIQVLNENKQLLDQLSVEVKATVDKIGAVSEGKLDQVASALIEPQATMQAYTDDQKRKVDVVHEILSKEVRLMHGSATEVTTSTLRAKLPGLSEWSTCRCRAAQSVKVAKVVMLRGSPRVPDPHSGPEAMEPDRPEEWRGWIPSVVEVL